MTSEHDPIEQLVKTALARSTADGLVVLERPEVSVAEMPAARRFFKCIEAFSCLYRLRPAAYELAENRKWVRGQGRIEDPRSHALMKKPAPRPLG